MWFGTYDGLNRYDGYGFTIYRNDPDDPATISDNQIHSICEDRREGVLWIGTQGGGLNKFDPVKEVFTSYRYEPGNPRSLSLDRVYSIYLDGDGVVWVGTWGGGLNRLDKEKGTFTHYRHVPEDPDSLSHDSILAIFEDKYGVMWIGTYGGGLNKFDRKNGRFIHYHSNPDDPYSLSGDRVTCIFETGRGELWIGTDGNGVNRFDRGSGRFTRYKHDPRDPTGLSHDRIADVREDQAGVLWIGTFGGGLDRFDYNTQTFIHHKNDPRLPGSLSCDRVQCLYVDNTEMLWIGTFSGGISTLDRIKKKFYSYYNIPGVANTLSSRKIRAVLEDSDGMLWVGTNGGGLNKIDRKTNRITVYKHKRGDPGSVSHDRIYALHEDKKEGALWVGLFDPDNGGLGKLDLATGTFTHYKHDPASAQSLSENRVRAICEDGSGALWLGTWGGGLNKFDRETETFTHYTLDDRGGAGSDNIIYCVYADRADVIWAGTWSDGLCRFNRDKETFTCYKHEPGNRNSLSHNRILSICEDGAGMLWLGTSGGGLNKFDRENDKWTVYSTGNGLPNNVVYGILEDEAGNLWLSSNAGLTKFDPRSETFKNYDSEDGLQGNEFNGGAYYKNSSGEMFFGGPNGLNSFYPDQIKDNPFVPPVVITGFKIFNKPVKIKNGISGKKEISLSYKDNYFSFDFVALNYRGTENNQYAYMLEGFDKDWVYCGTRHTVGYTNIRGGSYVFRVRGANNDGLWNTKGASVKITIRPPLWERWWFRVFMGLAVIAFVFFLYRYRVYRIRNRSRQLEEINKKLNLEIEERRKVESALRESEKNFRHIFETSIDVFYRADKEGKLLLVSPSGAKLLGYETVGDVVGKYISEAFYYKPEDRTEFLNAMTKMGKVRNFQVTLKAKNGEPVLVETNSHIIFDEQNNPVGVEGIFRDIRDRKRAEEENLRLQEQLHLAKKMEAVGNLAGGMAHEFNNLLSTIIGNAGMLQVATGDNPAIRKRVEGILNAANRSAALTDQLLSFSRKQLLKLETLDFNELIKDMKKDIIDTAGEGAEVRFLLDDQLEQVEADRGLMTQVVLGIVHNAKDAMPDGGELTLKTAMHDGTGSYVTLSIEDTGVGMDEEVKQHIFEPFFTTKAVGSGVGLALSFVWGTIKQHNGWIDVDSEPGQGTTFTIYLPAVNY
jgi:PAS domain S-box-containing protein